MTQREISTCNIVRCRIRYLRIPFGVGKQAREGLWTECCNTHNLRDGLEACEFEKYRLKGLEAHLDQKYWDVPATPCYSAACSRVGLVP